MLRIFRADAQRMMLVLVIGGALLASACQLLNLNMPRVKNHPQPMPSPNAAVFDDSSCPEENGRLTCTPEGALGRLGCTEIRLPGQVLDGLQPAYPLRLCLAAHQTGERLAEGEFIYREGCLMSEYIRYIVFKDGGFVLLKSVADLQRTYAPIESEAEALSFALAASGLGVRYGLTSQPDLRYFVNQLEDTHVETVPQGYQVRLFDYKLCGCGPHPTYAVDVLVTSDGQIRELNREKIYEDPAEDKLCVD